MRSRREAIAGMLLRLRAIGLSQRLMRAFEAVPRQNFVPVMHLDESYGRGQLPIECGQTMTGPDQVARTLQALNVLESHRVLEIGTGSGYQAALLGSLAAKVASLDRFRTLVDKAKLRLAQLEIANVSVELLDGCDGFPGRVFDRIIVNCALPEPPVFLDQLVSGGILIAPIGPRDGQQILRKFEKTGSRFEEIDLFPVRTQPMIKGISQAI